MTATFSVSKTWGAELLSDGAARFRLWAPSRWEGRSDAPTRVVSRWWPPYVPPASPPADEEQKIIDGWA